MRVSPVDTGLPEGGALVHRLPCRHQAQHRTCLERIQAECEVAGCPCVSEWEKLGVKERRKSTNTNGWFYYYYWTRPPLLDL